MRTKAKIIVSVLVVAIAAAIPFFLLERKISELEARLPQPHKASGGKQTSDVPAGDKLAMLKSILGMKDPLQMMHSLADFVSGLDATAIRPLLDYLVHLPGATRGLNLGLGALMMRMPSGMSGSAWNNNQVAFSVVGQFDFVFSFLNSISIASSAPFGPFSSKG